MFGNQLIKILVRTASATITDLGVIMPSRQGIDWCKTARATPKISEQKLKYRRATKTQVAAHSLVDPCRRVAGARVAAASRLRTRRRRPGRPWTRRTSYACRLHRVLPPRREKNWSSTDAYGRVGNEEWGDTWRLWLAEEQRRPERRKTGTTSVREPSTVAAWWWWWYICLLQIVDKTQLYTHHMIWKLIVVK